MMRALLLALLLVPSASTAGDKNLKKVAEHAVEYNFDRQFKEANDLYESGNFRGAVEIYRQLLSVKPRSTALNYNLGNAYFRLGTPGSLGRAIASYMRAFETNPRDGDVRNNYDFALRAAGEALIAPGTPKALFLLFHLLSHEELLALQWIGLWAALLLCSVYLLREPLQPKLRPYLIGAIAFWGVCALWLGVHHLTSIRRPGIVIVHNAEVRSGPGENFPVSFKVPEGWRVSRLDAKGGWIEIGVLKQGLKGWMASDSVEKI